MKNKSSIHRLSLYAMLSVSMMVMPIPVQSETTGSLADSLQQSLKAQGWHESKTEDGSVIYRQTPTVSPPIRKPAIPMFDRKALGQALKGRGWQADWQDDGSLVLRPKVKKNVTKTEKPSADTVTQETVLPDMSAFEYWRVVKSDDGAMMFYPVTEQEAVNKTAAINDRHDQCEEPKIDSQNIVLPVDQWEEVYQVAQHWLTESGMIGLVVGQSRPIRRFEWFHLVNLVSEHPPYYPHYQIAIRVSDGKVVLLQ